YSHALFHLLAVDPKVEMFARKVSVAVAAIVHDKVGGSGVNARCKRGQELSCFQAFDLEPCLVPSGKRGVDRSPLRAGSEQSGQETLHGKLLAALAAHGCARDSYNGWA